MSAPLGDFPLAEVPRGARGMDAGAILSMATTGPPLGEEELSVALAEHERFVAAGGHGGAWQPLSVAGLPLCVYRGRAVATGKQLVLRLRALPRRATLGGRDLRSADLSGSVCREIDLRGARLDGSAMTDAFFDGACFRGASLKNVDLSGSSLRGAEFCGAALEGADFEHTDCTGADFSGASLAGARFPGAILEGVVRERRRGAQPMSELWSAEVVNRGGTWIDLLVRQAHPDSGPFPEEAPFALALLTQEAYAFDASYNRTPNSPLGHQISFEESYKMDALKLRAAQFIRSVTVYRAINLPYDGPAAEARIEAAGVARDSEEWPKAWSAFFAPGYAEKKWLDFWGETGHPRATYRIEVTDPAWIQHLPPGTKFTSAAYGETGPFVDQNRDVPMGTPPDAQGLPPAPPPAGYAPAPLALPPAFAPNPNYPMVTFTVPRGGPPPKQGIPTWLIVVGVLLLIPVLGIGSCLVCVGMASVDDGSKAAPRPATTAKPPVKKK